MGGGGDDDDAAPKRARARLHAVVTRDRNAAFRTKRNLTARVLRRMGAACEDDDGATRRVADAVAAWFTHRELAGRCGHRYVLRPANGHTGHLALVYTSDAAGAGAEAALVAWLTADGGAADPGAMPPNPLDLGGGEAATAPPLPWAPVVAVVPECVRDGCDPGVAWRALLTSHPIMASYRQCWRGEGSPLAAPASGDAVRDLADLWASTPPDGGGPAEPSRTHATLAELRARLRWPDVLAPDAGTVVRLAKAMHRDAPWSLWVDAATTPQGYRPEAVPHLVQAALVVHGFHLGVPKGGSLARMWHLMHLS